MRPAKMSELEVGDELRATGMTCVNDGTIVRIERDDKGMFFRCGEGQHYLDGQLVYDENSDELVGLHWPGD